MIVAERLQPFKLHVTTLQVPLVVLLQQQRSDQTRDLRLVGEDADDVGALLLEQSDEWSLQRRYMQLEGLQALAENQTARLSAVVN